MAKSKLTTVPAYYTKYLALVNQEELIEALEESQKFWKDFIKKIPESKGEYRYEPEKWTVKEVLQHVIDTEMIFKYRALCISRGERKDLAGFDENVYAEHSFSNERSLKEINQDFNIHRDSTIAFFKSVNEDALKRKGSANGLVVSSELLGFISVGHQIHHLNIIKERYL